MDAPPGATRPAPQAGPHLPVPWPRHRLARGSPRSIGRWRPAFHPLVAGLGRPFSARTFRQLSRTLKEHFHGILAYLETRLTNAAIEAINGLLQMAKRIARGFRNFHYFRLAPYLKASRLHRQPHPLPT